MKSIVFVLFVTVISAWSSSCGSSDELTIDCDFYSDMASAEVPPDAKSLDYFIDSAHMFSEDFRKYYQKQKSLYGDSYDSLMFQIDTITYISNHAIVDIMLEVSPGGFEDEIGKMVLLETESGLFKLLYAALTRPGVYVPEKTATKNFGSYEIIYTKSRYHGQFTRYTEAYWMHNLEDNCFKRLDYYSAIRDTVESLMPDSCSLTRSNFVVDSLFWYNYLGKEGDHYRWPTCGRIKIWFRNEKCELIPEKIIYDPNDKAPH